MQSEPGVRVVIVHILTQHLKTNTSNDQHAAWTAVVDDGHQLQVGVQHSPFIQADYLYVKVTGRRSLQISSSHIQYIIVSKYQTSVQKYTVLSLKDVLLFSSNWNV